MGDHGSRGHYSPEVRARAVRMVLEHAGEYGSQWEAIRSISDKIGCTGETLRRWVRQAERDKGLRPGTTSAEAARIRALERENRELRQANEILRKASAYFAPSRRMRAFACRARRRSSTAGSSHDRVHRRSSGGLRGRADLQGAADCPVELSRACRQAARSIPTVGSGRARRCAEGGGPACVR